MKIIQFGMGRWGANHTRILEELGHQVETHDIEDNYWHILDSNHQMVDAVVVTTSSENHWPIAQYAMDLGLPVFVEKPALLKKSQLIELRKREDKRLLMVGHQYLFLPQINALKGICNDMFSVRNSQNPRTEGVLFALMVQDVAIAHYVMGVEWFECSVAEGSASHLHVKLENKNKQVELHATFGGELPSCQYFYTSDKKVILTPVNYHKQDLLKSELETFCAYVQKSFPIKFNGTTSAIQVMETCFKIKDKLEERS
jgi:predicted dehydrogenase